MLLWKFGWHKLICILIFDKKKIPYFRLLLKKDVNSVTLVSFLFCFTLTPALLYRMTDIEKLAELMGSLVAIVKSSSKNI